MSEQVNEVEKLAGTEVKFFIPDTDSLGMLDTLEPQFNLTMRYKTMEDWAMLKDQPVRAFYMGLKEIPNDKGEVVNCAVFVSKTECFISGQMLLIESVANLPLKTPVEITYKGKTPNKSTDGSTCVFNVVRLA